MITEKDCDRVISDEEFDAEWKEYIKKYGRTKEDRLISLMQEYLEKHEKNKRDGYWKDPLCKIKVD